MRTLEIREKLEQYFIDNWTQTQIQFEGVAIGIDGIDKWISLVYVPVENKTIGFDGTTTGRVRNNGQLKVFCYAKNIQLAVKLADDVKEFLDGKTISNGIVQIGVGQDSGAVDLENSFFEVLVVFEIDVCS